MVVYLTYNALIPVLVSLCVIPVSAYACECFTHNYVSTVDLLLELERLYGTAGTVDAPLLVSIGADTGSMEPTIRGGDLIVANYTVPFGDIVVGDIVKFRAGTDTIAHRVVGIAPQDQYSPTMLATRGDNAPNYISEWVSEEDYIARVEHVIPYIEQTLPVTYIVTADNYMRHLLGLSGDCEGVKISDERSIIIRRQYDNAWFRYPIIHDIPIPIYQYLYWYESYHRYN